MILVPAIDILGGKAVRLKKGDYDQVTVYNEDAVAQARAFEAAGAERVHIVDLDGARDGAPTNMELIKRMVAELSCEVEVGGGIRTMDAIQRYVDAGVRRVVLGSALVKDRAFAEEAAAKYGSVIVAGVDAKDGIVATEGWLDTADGVPAEELIADMQAMGIQHLVYTDIARDGMQTGLDAEAYAAMARKFPGMKITASGGLATLDDLRNLAATGAPIDGAITGRAIYEGVFTVEEGIALIKELEQGDENAD
ncbi:MAG: 1-(5-phosphoribosyl)-5-[(5-phosphoribosylamino)methylideneamino]imidazole-4-carboxamide isomerase [Coriobacteriia bacterium]|nr:1-(5-phosphoribosyl)-5-[(5-phosphoribosylamino)methylideneamino]imidazole-4-carboxamide isomerase [Coriobacteriia bacterium]